MTSPILLLAGRFLLASALLMALYWVVWRKQATYRAKRTYLLTMPFVALAISLLQVEVYKPEPVVVEVSGPSGLSPSGPNGPSPIPSQGRGVDTAPIMNSPIENEANSAALSEGQGISLPPHGEGKGWGPWGPWGLGLCLLYALIALLFFAPFVISMWQVRRLRKKVNTRKYEEDKHIHILMGQAVEAPFSFYRTIFLPQCLTEAQHRMILAHERGHILHRHYIDVWVSETVTRLFWWNPFLWWARQELRNVHEFEADSEVLGTGEDVLAYQTILIEEVLHGDIVIANGFNHSFIRRRFVEMLQSTNRRMSSMAKAGTAAWMLLVVALMCCTVGEAETVYKVKEQRPLSSLPQGEGVDSHAISEQQDITLPVKEQKEETAPADSGQWHQAKAINPRDYLPEVLSQIGNLNAEAVVQLLSTAASVQELTPEQYEELKKTMPNKNLPSLDSINSNAREIKKAIETIMLEGMTGMQTAIANSIREAALKPGEVVNVPMTTFEESFDSTFTVTVEAPWTEEVVIDNSFEAQNEALLRFIANWFELSENGVFLSKSEYEKKNIDMEEYPSYEEYSKNWNTNIVLETQLLSRYLNKLNSELRPQVEALLKEHGWIIPRDKEFIITIESKAFNKTWRLKKEPKESGIIHFFTAKEAEEINRIAKIANEPAITNDASLREQDEALQMFFKGWFDMNKMTQEPMLTEEEFQQAIKTEPIPPGFDPSYKAYKERTKNFIAEAKKKMEEGRARLNKEIRPQVEAVLKQHGMQFPPERQLKIIIRAAYKNATWEFENTTHPNAYGCAVNTNFEIVDDPSSPDYNEKKDFISPQWGLELPEGYVRLTDYKKLAETDATAKAQYNQLMSCFRNAQALRKEALTNAYKEKHPRYVSVEEATMAGIKELFRNAGIEMMEKGAYRLPDGTIVMEDDQHNLVPQSVDYQQGTTDRDPRLCNKAPRMERDKSPNYSPFNEQTWPVYTNVQTVPTNEYTPEPQVFRGKNCTYVVEHFHIVYNFHWFYISPSSKLVDTKTNDQYVKRYTEHFHSNNYVWIHGMEGKVIRLIVVFPPLPKNVTAVDYIPGRIPADERLSNASPNKEYKKLKVQELDESKGMKVVY